MRVNLKRNKKPYQNPPNTWLQFNKIIQQFGWIVFYGQKLQFFFALYRLIHGVEPKCEQNGTTTKMRTDSNLVGFFVRTHAVHWRSFRDRERKNSIIFFSSLSAVQLHVVILNQCLVRFNANRWFKCSYYPKIECTFEFLRADAVDQKLDFQLFNFMWVVILPIRLCFAFVFFSSFHVCLFFWSLIWR